MRLLHNAIRDWWHRPILDRLDAVERHARRATVTVTPSRRMHIEPGTTATELAKAMRQQMRSARPRPAAITHGVCGWCEQTVELVINNGETWLGDHMHDDRTCVGSGSDDYQPTTPEGVS